MYLNAPVYHKIRMRAFVIVLLCATTHSISINHHRLTPRHTVFAKLNDLESDFPPLTDPVDIIPLQPIDTEIDDDYDDDDAWVGINATAMPDDIAWLENALVNTTSNSSSSIVDDFMTMISDLLLSSNKTASFTFITHIQLKPRSCPNDVAAEFDRAIRGINPGVSVRSKPIRSGSVSCMSDGDCPCSDSLSSSLSRRKLVIQTLEIMTTVSSSVQLPNDLSFSYKVVPLK